MNNGITTYDSITTKEEAVNPTKSYFSSDEGLETFKDYVRSRKLGDFLAVYLLVIIAGFVAIIASLINDADLDLFTTVISLYSIIGFGSLLIFSIVVLCSRFSALKRMSAANPLLNAAYKHSKRSLALSLLAGLTDSVTDSAGPGIINVIGDLASAGLDIASSIEGYKSEYKLIYGILQEVKKDNDKSIAFKHGFDYVHRAKALLWLGIIMMVIFGIVEVFATLKDAHFAISIPSIICGVLIIGFLTFAVIRNEIIYFRFLKSCLEEFERANLKNKSF